MKFIKPLALVGILILLGWLLYLPATRQALLAAATWAETEPFLAAPLYVLFLVVAVVLMFPVWGVLMIGGYLFGFVWGILLAWLAYQVGAFMAFIVARTVARDWVIKKFANSEKFQNFEASIERNGFKAIFLTRAAVIFPTNLINLFAGISAIKQSSFVVATALGSIPLIAFYVFLGAKSSNLINAMADGTFQAPTIPMNILLPLLLVIVAVVVALVLRSARKKKLAS